MRSLLNYILIATAMLFFQHLAFAQQTPCTALPLTFSSADCGAISTTVTGNFGAATASGLADPGGCGGGVFSGGLNDYYVSAVVPLGQSSIRFEMEWSGCGLFCVSNPGWAVYLANGGSCNSLTPLICGGDDSVFPSSTFDVSITSLNPGDILILRVWETDNQDSDIDIQAMVIPSNDFCSNALPLQGTGCNYQASDLGEPDTWAPNQGTSQNNCSGGDWSSNENGVWYTLTVDASTPQPITIEMLNVVCDNTGAGNMQMGIWTNSNSCNLDTETMVECVVGIGTVALGPTNLALGNYYLFVDGNAGANCTWEFESEEVLPIELGRFSGQILKQEAHLDWTTFTEHNNDYFEVMHSTTGIEFTSIGKVVGNGTTNQNQDYHFIHPNPLVGENYYRIKQVDLSGHYTFSKTIVLSFLKSRIVEVYPNPMFGETLNFDVEGFGPTQIRFSLSDVSGKQVMHTIKDYENEPTIQFQLPGLSRGTYFYSIELEGIAYLGKIMK